MVVTGTCVKADCTLTRPGALSHAPCMRLQPPRCCCQLPVLDAIFRTLADPLFDRWLIECIMLAARASPYPPTPGVHVCVCTEDAPAIIASGDDFSIKARGKASLSVQTHTRGRPSTACVQLRLLLLFAVTVTVTPTAMQATFPVERACTPNIASCGCACCLGTKVTVFSKASESGCDIGALCTSKADATAVTDLETTVTNTNERVLALEIKQAEADEARVKAVGGVFCASSGMAVALRCVCMQCEHVSSSSQQLKLTLWYVCVCACACVRAYVYARACVPVYGMVCA